MEVGYGLLTAQRPPDADHGYERVYRDSIRLAQLAEEHGFDAVWTSEHHFFDDGYVPAVFPLSAALAQATETVTVGTSVALAPLYHPVRLAEDAATVDLISGGRFRLGIANGYMDREFEVFDAPKEERATRVVETIELCRRAWQPGSFSFDGRLYQYEDLRVEPTPAQADGPPIYLGGTSEQAVERAIRRADGHIGIVYYDESMSYRSSFTQFQDNVETMAGRVDDFAFAMMQYAHVHSDRDTAWEQLRPSLVYSRRKYAQHAPERDASRWEPASMSPDRLEQLRAGALVGTPEDVLERLQTYDEETPRDLHVIIRMWHPLLSFEANAAAIRLFGEEVLPRLP